MKSLSKRNVSTSVVYNRGMKRTLVILILCILVALGIYFTFKSINLDTGNLPLDVNYNTVELNLQNKGLTSLPSEIGKFANLTTFDVSHNSLTGALPAEIGKFTKLEILDASDNNLTGIPAEIGRLTKLETVDCSQ